jgi:SAM-dependent methyltransferase
VDIRPLQVELPNLTPLEGDVANELPFAAASVSSLSCLHVAEHVGLGRYGDVLAADGTARACAELARVLAPAGNLFFSLPVGKPRVCFNAHRIHAPRQILDYFASLELVEFSVVGDDYRLHLNADPDEAARLDYGCGLFWLRREG